MTTVLITGANRGIGLALATQYAQAGCDLIVTARNPKSASNLSALQGKQSKVEAVALDVTRQESFAPLVRQLDQRPIDIVIANAGVYLGRGGVASEANDETAWAATFATNVTGVYFTARAFLPNLKLAKAGKLAIISSQMGSSARAQGGSYSYRASKAAASNLAANLAVELKPLGIAVASYHPGWVRTDMGSLAADIAPEASAAGLIARIAALSLAKTGVFEDYKGAAMPF